MQGSTLASMAEALDEAVLVLFCVSQKYKDSDNCRLEAEYVRPPSLSQSLRVPLVWQGLAVKESSLWTEPPTCLAASVPS